MLHPPVALRSVLFRIFMCGRGVATPPSPKGHVAPPPDPPVALTVAPIILLLIDLLFLLLLLLLLLHLPLLRLLLHLLSAPSSSCLFFPFFFLLFGGLLRYVHLRRTRWTFAAQLLRLLMGNAPATL